MEQLHRKTRTAAGLFRQRLERLEREGGFTLERYVRYLSMQHHLTNGVQQHFYAAAAHPDMARRRGLKKFLVSFADEEEPHFRVAQEDLAALGRVPLAPPLEVELWWAYFDGVVGERPFLRLGATAVLENLASESQDVITRLMKAATFLTHANSKFFTIHRHEALPHGDEILGALAAADLEERHVEDLVHGAEVATALYLRMVQWSLDDGASGCLSLQGLV